MTSATKGNISTRGRGLDALFEGNPPPIADQVAVDADLAALLDSEVRAAAGTPARSRAPLPAVARPATLPPPAVDDLSAIDMPAHQPVGAETIDVPTGAPPAAARPAESVRPAPTGAPPAAPASTPSAAPVNTPPASALPSAPPITHRFGAIIMEAAPAEPDVQLETAGSATPVVGPAGELLPAEDVAVVPAGRSKAALEVRAVPAGPGAEPEDKPLPAAIERSDDQKTIIINRLNQVLDKGWQKALHGQIDDLYKQVAIEFSSPPANAEKALSMLREARQILVDTPEEYVAAEYRTLQVRAMLSRTRESRTHSAYFGPRLLAYEGGWLLLFLVGLIFANPLAQAIGRLGNITDASIMQVFPVWGTMMWGGIGGVIGALYHLWWHISDRQDFDRQYFMWYMVQPIMGMVLGGIVFLLMAGGLLVLQVNLTNNNASTAAQLLPYLLAVLGGFRQNFVYEQFDRVIALFTSGGQEKKSEGGSGDTVTR